VAEKPRILVLRNGQEASLLSQCHIDAELVYADSVPRAAAMLQRGKFAGVYADTTDLTLIQQVGTLFQADRVLEQLSDGVALIDAELRIIWANAEFIRWCEGQIQGRPFYDALAADNLGPDPSPFLSSLRQGPITVCLQSRDNRFLHLTVTPVRSSSGELLYYVGVGRDITQERLQQQKLDAIHSAGQELAAISPQDLAEMSLEERLALLKSNILRYVHELLHYDQVDIRLIDASTGRLELLLSEGMKPETTRLELFARPTGNGVTGYVAYTGKSYLCPDTSHDPLYIEGAAGAKSSLTVPLIAFDKVVGTFNVESPKPNAFTEEDQQFLEIFSRKVANALHLLELLVAERRGMATQSIEMVSREVALPVDEVLTAATALLDRYIGHDEDMTRRLQHVVDNARLIKQSIQKVGESITPPAPGGQAPEPPHPQLRGLRVLVVDNDERVRKSAHGLLGRFGCVVETSHDGKEALAMARLSTYDAMLVDIRLPDMTGYEAFRQLRRLRPHLDIILMSAFGYDPGHNIVKARQEGLRHVLYKPFRVDQLLDALVKTVSGAPAVNGVTTAVVGPG
jgi:CheY-like chemotaxis protein/GAF domain-containing protein